MNSSHFAAHKVLKNGVREELQDVSVNSFTRPA